MRGKNVLEVFLMRGIGPPFLDAVGVNGANGMHGADVFVEPGEEFVGLDEFPARGEMTEL